MIWILTLVLGLALVTWSCLYVGARADERGRRACAAVWAALGPFTDGRQSALFLEEASRAVLGMSMLDEEELEAHRLCFDRNPGKWELARRRALNDLNPRHRHHVNEILARVAPGSPPRHWHSTDS